MNRTVASLLSTVSAAALLMGVAPAPAALAAAGTTVSGYVYQEVAPGVVEPVRGAGINILPADGNASNGAATVQTDATGKYTLTGVPAGRYRVHARPAAVWEDVLDTGQAFLGDTPFPRDAEVISVGTSALAISPITLPLGGRITGTVTVTGATPAYGELVVEARQYNPDTGAFEGDLGNRVPDVHGAYAIEDLNPGLYLVSVSSTTGEVRGEYLPGTPSIQGSQLLEVVAGDEHTSDFAIEATARSVTRMAGADRYATSAAISARSFTPGVPVAYVASGAAFPDALGAGALAGVQGGPVLLTAPAKLPGSIAAELDRLDPARIVVVGGPASVSDGVLRALRAYSADVDRLGGSDRFATARAVIRDTYQPGGAETVYVASGMNFPDALSAASAAAGSTAPLILVNGAGSGLDSGTAKLLGELGPSKVVIAGGSGAVSTGIERDLRRLTGVRLVERVWGWDRFGTSRELAIDAAAFDTVYLANGMDFPDALSGSAVAGSGLAGLFLVQRSCIPSETLNYIRYAHPNRVVLLGGTGVLGSGVAALRRC